MKWIYLIIISSVLWGGGLKISDKQNLFAHNPIDQHTRQAQAWMQGQIHIDPAPSYLELAEFNGRHYNSFPPAPTFIEVPLLALFGPETPSYLAFFVLCCMAGLAMFRMGTAMGGEPLATLIVVLTFLFGTNIFTSMIQGGVWGQGQVFGFCFAIFGFYFIYEKTLFRRPGLAYFSLAFATGCRPFYLFLFPLLMLMDCKERGLKPVFRDAILYGAPLMVFYAGYNFLRFNNPFEFGHTFLPWSQSLPSGIFSTDYLARNFTHAFLKIPEWKAGFGLNFDGRGTAFWINNPIFLISMAGLFRGRLPLRERVVGILTLLIVWTPLLLHESNGWYQFGYRFLIDLLPIAFLGMISWTRLPALKILVPVLIYSLLINAYGIWWMRLTSQ